MSFVIVNCKSVIYASDQNQNELSPVFGAALKLFHVYGNIGLLRKRPSLWKKGLPIIWKHLANVVPKVVRDSPNVLPVIRDDFRWRDLQIQSRRPTSVPKHKFDF